jgi:uncharacterized protein YdaU (DUF1376 family)
MLEIDDKQEPKKYKKANPDKEMMDNPAFFPFYGRDYLASIRNLTLTQTGCFHLLLIWAYQYGHGTIPNDMEQLKGICGIRNKEGQAAMEKVLDLKWHLSEDQTHYYIGRIGETLVDMQTNYDRAVLGQKHMVSSRKEKAMCLAFKKEASFAETMEQFDEIVSRYLDGAEDIDEIKTVQKKHKLHCVINNEKKKLLKAHKKIKLKKVANSREPNYEELEAQGEEIGHDSDAPVSSLDSRAHRDEKAAGIIGKGGGIVVKNNATGKKHMEKPHSFKKLTLARESRSKASAFAEVSAKAEAEALLPKETEKKSNEIEKILKDVSTSSVTVPVPDSVSASAGTPAEIGIGTGPVHAATEIEEDLTPVEKSECYRRARVKLREIAKESKLDFNNKRHFQILQDHYDRLVEEEKTLFFLEKTQVGSKPPETPRKGNLNWLALLDAKDGNDAADEIKVQENPYDIRVKGSGDGNFTDEERQKIREKLSY